MKKTLFLLMAMGLVTPSLKAQDVAPLTYSEVIQVDGVSKDELYNRAKLFLVNSFDNANRVIHSDDKEAGIIVIKAIMHCQTRIPTTGRAWAHSLNSSVRYTLTLSVKDGRYKVDVEDLTYNGDDEYIRFPVLLTTSELEPGHNSAKGKNNIRFRQLVWDETKKQVDEYFSNLFLTINSGMTKPSPAAEDW